MTMSRAERDAAHNAGLPEGITVHTSTADWVDWGPGIQMQLLRATPENGHWSCLFKCAAGSAFGRHEHLGPGEFLVLKGRVEVRGGAENGGLTSREGDYVYEPNGVIHDENWFPEESLIYFSNDGPLKFLDDDDNVTFVCDWRAVRDVDLAARRDKDPRNKDARKAG
jgi:quercetin dioxygenase-like cupin family protein